MENDSPPTVSEARVPSERSSSSRHSGQPRSYPRRLWGAVVAAITLIVELFKAVVGIGHPSDRNKARHLRKLCRTMENARCYDQWRAAAREVDDLNGYASWSVDEETRQYNFAEVSRRITALSQLRTGDHALDIMRLIHSDVYRGTCGITNPLLFRYMTGTKAAIRTYTNLVVYLCKDLAKDTTIPAEEKVAVLSNMARAYGYSCLVLTGSVALGAYHIGVVKALAELNLLPKVLFGSSTGAIVAAFACTKRDVVGMLDVQDINYQAFDKRGQTGSTKRKIARLFREGNLMDVNILSQFLEDNFGDITFSEAYKATGRVLNIYIHRKAYNGQTSWLLNYLSAPNVLIRTAAAAACATPGLYAEVTLKARAVDGELVDYNPITLQWSRKEKQNEHHVNHAMKRMREMFNVNMFILSDAALARLPFLQLHTRQNPLAQALSFLGEECFRAARGLMRCVAPLRNTQLSNLMEQLSEPVEGDVIVYPASRPSDLLQILNNASMGFVKHCTWRGQQAIWPRVELLKVHLSVEHAIDDVLGELRLQCANCPPPSPRRYQF